MENQTPYLAARPGEQGLKRLGQDSRSFDPDAPPREVQRVNAFFIFGLLVLILVLLCLASVPFFGSSDGGGSRSSEPRAVLHEMMQRARSTYQRTGKAPSTWAELGLREEDVEGSYFKQVNYSLGGNAKHWWARCTGVYSQAPTDLIFTADLETGSASFNR